MLVSRLHWDDDFCIAHTFIWCVLKFGVYFNQLQPKTPRQCQIKWQILSVVSSYGIVQPILPWEAYPKHLVASTGVVFLRRKNVQSPQMYTSRRMRLWVSIRKHVRQRARVREKRDKQHKISSSNKCLQEDNFIIVCTHWNANGKNHFIFID